ncbi:MAG: hypothetical protein KW804_02875, partial [Candidatus Doudnabacteria bacterium]|nr:hypothetical protein [Candidatus Doudnabacteria bacterium]
MVPERPNYFKFLKPALYVGVFFVIAFASFVIPNIKKAQAAACSSVTWSAPQTQPTTGTIPNTKLYLGVFKATCNNTAGGAGATVTVIQPTLTTGNPATTYTGFANMRIYSDAVASCATVDPRVGTTLTGTTATVNSAKTSVTLSSGNAIAAGAGTFLCFYVVMDIGATANNSQTIDVSIVTTTDVTTSIASAAIANLAPAGSTTITKICASVAGAVNWNASASWTGCNGGAGGSIPVATDAVHIIDGSTVTANVVSGTAAASITMDRPDTANGLIITDGQTLTISGALTFATNNTANAQTVTLGTSTGVANLTVGSISIPATTAATGTSKIICGNASNTGTLTVSGSGTIGITGSSVASSGASSIDMSAGACSITTGTGATTITGGTVSAALLKIGTGTLTANGNITFAGTAAQAQLQTVNGSKITFNGTSTVSTGGTLTITSTTNLTVQNNATATWNYVTSTWGTLSITSGATLAPGANLQTFAGNIACAGTISGSGGVTFSTTSGTIASSGTCTVSNSGTVTISGTTAPAISGSWSIAGVLSISGGGTTAVTNAGTITVSGTAAGSFTIAGKFTNNGTVTLSGSTTVNATLTGVGTFTNNTNGIFNYAGAAPTVTTFTATANPNTVNYNGTTQTCKVTSYYNLNFSTSGAKTCALVGGTNTVQNVVMSGTVSWTATANTTVSGNLTVGTGTTLSLCGAATLNFTVTGLTDVTGTVNCAGGSGAGTKAFNGGLTINANGVWDLSAQNTSKSFGGNVTMNGTTFTPGAGVVTITASLSFLGSSNMTFTDTVTINSGFTLTNGNIGTVNFSAGSVLNGGSGTSNYAPGLNSTTKFAAAPMALGILTPSTSANTVEYTYATPTCKATTTNPYYHLKFSGSGTVTCSIASTNGDLTFTTAGSIAYTTGQSISIGGALSVGNGATMTVANTHTLTVAGDTTIGAGATGILTCAATAGNLTFRGNLTLNVGSTYTKTNCGNVIFAKGSSGQTLTDSTASKQDLGTVQVSANSTATTLILATNSTMTNLTVNASQIFDTSTFTLTLSGDLTPTGTVQGTGSITVSGGDVNSTGIINMTGGTFLVGGTGTFGGSNSTWTFNNLTFGGGSTATTTTGSGSGAITVSGSMTVAANQTLDAGSKTWDLYGTQSAGSWTFVNDGTNGNSASGASLTASVTGVHAGDLVVVAVKWEATDTTITVCDDGVTCAAGHVFTETSAGHAADGNGGFGSIFYLLSSTSSGNVTYTVTWSAARTFRDVGVMVYTPPAAASLDGTPAKNNGSSAAFASGSITTTGTTGLAFGYFGDVGQTLTSPQINGSAADRSKTFGLTPNSLLWSKAYAAGFTGQATGTVTPSGLWFGGVIAFKAATTGSLSVSGIFTANSSTVNYRSISALNIPALTYNNVAFIPASGSPTYTLGSATSQTITANGTFTVGNGSNAVT